MGLLQKLRIGTEDEMKEEFMDDINSDKEEVVIELINDYSKGKYSDNDMFNIIDEYKEIIINRMKQFIMDNYKQLSLEDWNSENHQYGIYEVGKGVKPIKIYGAFIELDTSKNNKIRELFNDMNKKINDITEPIESIQFVLDYHDDEMHVSVNKPEDDTSRNLCSDEMVIYCYDFIKSKLK